MLNTDGGPAFPGKAYQEGRLAAELALHPGMSLRDYACIKLKVPESDREWLNELIVKSLRNEFAEMAMDGVQQMICLLAKAGDTEKANVRSIVKECYEYADAMLKEREK